MLKALPVKFLLRFNCVSKQWLSIIDDPYFVSLHRVRSHSRPGGVRFLVDRVTEHGRDFFSFHPEESSTPQLIFSLKWRSTIDLLGENLLNVGGFIEFWLPGSQRRWNHVTPPRSSVEGLVFYNDQIWNLSTRKRIYFPILDGEEYEYWDRKPQYFLGFNLRLMNTKFFPFVAQEEKIGLDMKYGF